jgi:hypothetical protein
MAVALRHLVDDLAAPISASVLDRLLAAAAGTDTIEREAALFGTRAAPLWSVGRALRASRDWRTRVFVRWLALPSPRYLRLVETARYSWLPLASVHRPVRYMARRLQESATVGVARDHPNRGR